MKALFWVLFTVGLLTNYAQANSSVNGCEIKKQHIQRQMVDAKAHNNLYRLQGLERALSNVERYCTPEKVIENTRAELNEKQCDVSKRELELKEAQLKGDASKIAKREQKLAEAKAELKDIEDELNLLTKP